jgi:hypothetical protein
MHEEYELAKRRFSTHVLMLEWPEALAALEDMLRHRPCDECLEWIGARRREIRDRILWEKSWLARHLVSTPRIGTI